MNVFEIIVGVLIGIPMFVLQLMAFIIIIKEHFKGKNRFVDRDYLMSYLTAKSLEFNSLCLTTSHDVEQTAFYKGAYHFINEMKEDFKDKKEVE